MQWEVDKYGRHAGYVAELGEKLLDLLSPVPEEKILDVGCGDGRLTAKIASIGCSVIGIDTSGEMVAAARDKGIDARVVDAQSISIDDEFDAVFSNAALHWMKDADAVIRNVYARIKAGGRFCAEFGAENNVGAVVSAIYAQLNELSLNGDDYNPWYFPSGSAYRSKLEQHGFHIVEFEVFDRPTKLPTGIVGWLETFADSFLKDIPVRERADFIAHVADRAAVKLKDENGEWFADYVRCRFLARKT